MLGCGSGPGGAGAVPARHCRSADGPRRRPPEGRFQPLLQQLSLLRPSAATSPPARKPPRWAGTTEPGRRGPWDDPREPRPRASAQGLRRGSQPARVTGTHAGAPESALGSTREGRFPTGCVGGWWTAPSAPTPRGRGGRRGSRPSRRPRRRAGSTRPCPSRSGKNTSCRSSYPCGAATGAPRHGRARARTPRHRA